MSSSRFPALSSRWTIERSYTRTGAAGVPNTSQKMQMQHVALSVRFVGTHYYGYQADATVATIEVRSLDYSTRMLHSGKGRAA